jgi:hypothetical protein
MPIRLILPPTLHAVLIDLHQLPQRRLVARRKNMDLIKTHAVFLLGHFSNFSGLSAGLIAALFYFCLFTSPDSRSLCCTRSVHLIIPDMFILVILGREQRRSFPHPPTSSPLTQIPSYALRSRTTLAYDISCTWKTQFHTHVREEAICILSYYMAVPPAGKPGYCRWGLENHSV